MCGIIAILRRPDPSRSDAPELAATVGATFDSVLEVLCSCVDSTAALGTAEIDGLDATSTLLDPVVSAVRTPAGIRALLADSSLVALVQDRTSRCTELCDRIEAVLDGRGTAAGSLESLRSVDVERANAALLKQRDNLWSVARDALGAVEGVRRLLSRSGSMSLEAVTAALSIHQSLSSLDRMEVRGRDSAGLHLLLSGHGLDPQAPDIAATVNERTSRLFENREVRFVAGPSDSIVLSLVFKVAKEIGELGDNVRALRADIENDELLARALRSSALGVAVLGHTRWASVGLITEPNAHPLNQEGINPGCGDEPYAVAVHNGDVDNYADLKSQAGLDFADEITTDTKVIPALVSQHLATGSSLEKAFLDTVASFRGSVAIGLQAAQEPGKMMLALYGSGQAVYVGLAEDTFIVASELYGVVELCDRYVRLDGETPGNPDNPNGSRGQVMTLDGALAGSLEGLALLSYDGTELPITEDDVRIAEITTRDVDRGDYAHYLLKEISEAPRSFEKTLRGRFRKTDDGALSVVLGESTIPASIEERLTSGAIERILVIGQGTAAVAGRGIAEVMARFLGDRLREVRALPATELSGFGMRAEMSDTLVIAISQSGTTTDTNRTVDLVRSRGAGVLAIVNRRNSDLCDKADGVLFTSDGRDVEMSVASTKAFYSQIAAGLLLTIGLTERVLGEATPHRKIADLIANLRRLPDALRSVIGLRGEISNIAGRLVTPHRYWALVGNGLNRIAAEEVRIKLSELCYKSIACDATEDKKHIDLSSEPMIVVCAAGLEGSTADDVAKEVAIYRAHKATTVVIASEGEQRFNAASAVINVPRVHPSLDFVLASLAGHLFGYAAALAIDAQATPLRQVRSSIEELAHRWIEQGEQAEFFSSLLAQSAAQMQLFLDELAKGSYNGHLEASTATEVGLLLRTVMGQITLEGHAAIFGGPASPASVIEALSGALTQGIDELTRPVDAIKHQAKTVTVGISRSDEALLTVPLVAAVLDSGGDRDRVSYADLKTLAALDSAVLRVLGHTRYLIEGDPADEKCVIRKLDASGMARDFESRTAHKPVLRGTKRRVALDRRVLVARGSSDGRLFILVPEVAAGRTQGLVLIHIQLEDRCTVPVLRGVLQGYRNRYEQLRDAVMETEDTFREDHLLELSVEQLLIEPVADLAERWRAR